MITITDTPVGVRSAGATEPAALPAKVGRTASVATNLGRRIEALQRKVIKDHDYRVKIWAQAEIRIQGRVAELAELGGDIPELFKPDFEDRVLLFQYAAQKDDNAALPTV